MTVRIASNWEVCYCVFAVINDSQSVAVTEDTEETAVFIN